jgi:hypothetical protein
LDNWNSNAIRFFFTILIWWFVSIPTVQNSSKSENTNSTDKKPRDMSWFQKQGLDSGSEAWEALSEKVLVPMITETNRLDSDSRLALQCFAMEATAILEHLLLPEKGQYQILRREITSVSPAELREAYNAMVWTNVGLYAKSNPRLSKALINGCTRVVGAVDGTMEKARLEFIQLEDDLTPICSQLFTRVCNVMNVKPADTLDWYRFATIFAGSQKRVTEHLNQHL